jgi:hypothetical protein
MPEDKQWPSRDPAGFFKNGIGYREIACREVFDPLLSPYAWRGEFSQEGWRRQETRVQWRRGNALHSGSSDVTYLRRPRPR